ncbi:hypothetical protein AB0K60_15680 [Thermopolyspora sp. NPDC052614]|uniref:hypothetical protein n=1 Tax=Thermopolyspora sp. NPDC052614 TaxID=3155682 RepID=UPI00342D5E63
MSYRFTLHGRAIHDMKNLPFEAVHALAQRTADLIEAPWDATAIYSDGSAHRRTTFGDGRGIVEFHVNDEAEVITIYRVVWAG